ncbi:hypothetical protein ACLKA7_013274 [Drosophila subpalustris]
MRDLHPLADCWIQMLLIKKKIQRRSIILNKYKLQGRKRLQVMRKLRDELLQNLRTLIDVKLEKIRLSKRGGKRGRMMRLYKSCLHSWQKYLKSQQIKLKEMEQEEYEFDRQLRLLRKKLQVLPNRRHLLTQYLKDFEIALDTKESGRKYQSRKDNHIMKTELEKIISFLLSRKDKHINRTKYRPIQLLLKDVIKGHTMLDILADKESILKNVAKHYMWKNLANVYNDLTSVGVSKPEIFNVLKEQYLKYIDEIVGEAIQKGALVIDASQLSWLTDKESMGSSDSFEDYLSKSRPKQEFAMRKTLAEIKELPSPPISPPQLDALSMLSMEIPASNEHVSMMRRYSATNLRNIYNAHARYFDSLVKHPKDARMSESKRREAAIARDLRRNAKAKARKTKRKQQKKVDSTRLYYEPRKTCRERSIANVNVDADKETEAKECKCELSKCSRCGVELPPRNATPASSSSDLSFRSTAACGMNKYLAQFTADICDQSGFVHDQQSFCPMPNESSTSEMQQLRLIKEISRYFDARSSLSFGARIS